jgi:hypothetical protein
MQTSAPTPRRERLKQAFLKGAYKPVICRPSIAYRLPRSERTALYRHFNAAGDLLYIGISLSAVERLSAHMATSKWAGEIATVKIEYFDNRGLALNAERVAIISEKPIFNIIHSSEAVAANDNVAPLTKVA